MTESPTILLVEDNDDDAELMIRALRGTGNERRMLRLPDGNQALDYLFGRGPFAERATLPLPQLVLLDLRLPRMDGIDVLKALRDNPRTSQLPIVMLTTSNEERDRALAYENRVNSYVVKPVDYDEFVKLVQHLVRYWIEVNQARP